MRKLWPTLAVILLAACTATQATQPLVIDDQPTEPSGEPTVEPIDEPTTDQFSSILAGLDDLGPAPELENEVWVNSEQPLRLENLSGKVVLIEMWTFG